MWDINRDTGLDGTESHKASLSWKWVNTQHDEHGEHCILHGFQGI